MATTTYNRPTILDCGHAPTITTGIGTGYATNATTGQTMCYGCADSRTAHDVADSNPGDRITLYVSSAGTTITTWSGGVIMTRVHFMGQHPWSSRHEPRHYLRAIDADGRVWSGVGAAGMWATLRLTKRVDVRGPMGSSVIDRAS